MQSKITFSEIRSMTDEELLKKFGTKWETRITLRIKEQILPEHCCCARVASKDGGFSRCSRRFHKDSEKSTGHKLCKLHARKNKKDTHVYKKLGLITDPAPEKKKKSIGPPCCALVSRKKKGSNRFEIKACGFSSIDGTTFCTRCSKPYVDKNGNQRKFAIAERYGGNAEPKFKHQCYGTVENPNSWVSKESERLANMKSKPRKAKTAVKHNAYEDVENDDDLERQHREAIRKLEEAHAKKMVERETRRSGSDSMNSSQNESTVKADENESDSESDSDMSAEDE